MSFLAWVFAIGGLTIAFPILFHLIRPTPRGRQPFGSLMFLRQSPPRITRRSRIDNWLLLLLRGLAILLITAAFMRPFLRSASGMFFGDLAGQQLAILVDTSASMRRTGIWPKAVQRVHDALSTCKPGDQIALYHFSEQLHELVPFPTGSPDESESAEAIIAGIADGDLLEPGFGKTNLGEALMALGRIVSEAPNQPESEITRRILLISDFQSGASLAELQGEEWPDDVSVELASVQPDQPGNASVFLAGGPTAQAAQESLGQRVRVVNNVDSEVDHLRVGWADNNGQAIPGTLVDFYVPAGTSQVLPVAQAQGQTSRRLTLLGDDCPFDNDWYVTNRSQQELFVDWLGDKPADEPQSAWYFLQRVFPETTGRRVTVRHRESALDYSFGSQSLPQLVVVSRQLDDNEAKSLRQLVEQGANVLVVLTESEMLPSVTSLVGAVELVQASDSDTSDYLMFTEIDFGHPLFSPLSGSRYNDFSKIRFWKTVALTMAAGSDLTTLARFDDGNMAVWENRLGTGTVIGMATSWEPEFSQLALSTRFLPLMWSMLGLSRQTDAAMQQYESGQRLQLPESTADDWVLEGPGGLRLELSRATASETRLDQPGLYKLTGGSDSLELVVNLSPDECVTSPMPLERLEGLGVKTGTTPDDKKMAAELQKMSEIQMEGRQRIWKWLILAALILLLVETALAGLRSKTESEIEVATA